MFKERNVYTVDRDASKDVKFYWLIGKIFQFLAWFTFFCLWIISEQYHNDTNTKYPDWFENLDAMYLVFIPVGVWLMGGVIVILAKIAHWWDHGGIS